MPGGGLNVHADKPSEIHGNGAEHIIDGGYQRLLREGAGQVQLIPVDDPDLLGQRGMHSVVLPRLVPRILPAGYSEQAIRLHRSVERAVA